jgi:hypothetical protein
MKMLLGCVLLVAVSGCIPIGIQGRTSATDAPGTVASAHPAATLPAAAVARVSV